MSRAAAINDALRPAGRAMTVGTVGPADPPCPDCGGDAFSCTCGPVRDVFTADEVRAAVAESDRKRAKAVADARAYASALRELRARVNELERVGSTAAGSGRADDVSPRRVSGDPLGDYLARLVIPEKRAYAESWVAHVRDGAPAPADPGPVVWDAADVERKVRRWARRMEVVA